MPDVPRREWDEPACAGWPPPKVSTGTWTQPTKNTVRGSTSTLVDALSAVN
ncbi:hypothetical protein ARZXY2_4023 [Arthrobacter sp. ZXY-2]|nr:hypothetical protein ARZXY2_4023 [Arthrobacter sp. ZXY-2]